MTDHVSAESVPIPPNVRRARSAGLLQLMEIALAECEELHLMLVGARLSSAMDVLRSEVARIEAQANVAGK